MRSFLDLSHDQCGWILRKLFMEDCEESFKVPTSHQGWSIQIHQGIGPYGSESIMASGERNGVKISAMGWNQEIAWSTLRDMIRQRTPE